MSGNNRALDAAPSATEEARTGLIGALLVAAGAATLALAPNPVVSAASMLILVGGLTLRPATGLPLLGLVLPFYTMQKDFGSMSFSMPELILLAMIAGAAIHAVRLRPRPSWQGAASLTTPFDLPVALFLAAALLSLLASEVIRVSLRDLRTLILEPMAAFYMAAWLLRTPARPLWLPVGLLLGGVAAAMLGLYQYFFTDHVVAVEGARRILGPYLSPNQLGLYLGRTIPIALAFTLFTPRFRLIVGAGLAALAVAQVLTFSVGAWLGTLLAVLGVVLLWKPASTRAVVAGAAALALAAIPLLSIDRVSSHLSVTRGTSFIRIQLWESSLRMIRDHPLLGVGMDNFLYQYRSGYMRPDAVAEPNLSHPHNIILNFWLQIGVLGLAAMVWLVAKLVRCWLELWRASPQPWERAVLAGLAGAAIDMVAHGAVDNSYFLVDMAFFFWLSAGMMAAMHASAGAALHAPDRIG